MVSLALICSFSKMRGYLKLGDSKGDEIPEDTIKAVADTLRTSKALKVSEDGKSFLFFFLSRSDFDYLIFIENTFFKLDGEKV